MVFGMFFGMVFGMVLNNIFLAILQENYYFVHFLDKTKIKN